MLRDAPNMDATGADALSGPSERWLVTGAAGDVGAALVERLLELDQTVVGLDDFSSGRRDRLEAVKARVGSARWLRFSLVDGDVRDASTCAAAVAGMHWVVHQAARGPGSSTRDIHSTNVDGFVNVALAASEAGVRGLVHASSASVYGDVAQPHRESQPRKPVTAYAASKAMAELYGQSLTATGGLRTVALRYFNVVGEMSPTSGAVVPRWLHRLARGQRPIVHGDGLQTRDFVGIDDVVRATLLAAVHIDAVAGDVVNVGSGHSTPLRDLFERLREGMVRRGAPCRSATLQPGSSRAGDLRHSRACTAKAVERLDFEVHDPLPTLLERAMDAVVATRPRTRWTPARLSRQR